MELDAFEGIAGKYGLSLAKGGDGGGNEQEGDGDFRPNPITRAYVDFFQSVSSPLASLLEGLVALWATEKVYYEAWSYAKSCSDSSAVSSVDLETKGDADEGALRAELIPNWTSKEFGEFVETITGAVDRLWEIEVGRVGKRVVERRAEEVWAQILWLEERFWPDVE